MSHPHQSFIELPEELQINIFLRLPVKCLLICKCVCKPFCTIIQTPNFTNAHLTRSRPVATKTSQSLIFGFIDTTRIPYIQCHNHLLSIENTRGVLSSSPLTPPIECVGDLFLVGSCNGLICFDVRNNFDSEDNFLLWNPVTRQNRYLPRLENRSKFSFSIIEFGFVGETNEYMLIKVVKRCNTSKIEIELYKMSTNSWTVSCNTTFGKLIPAFGQGWILTRETSVFINGCFHWETLCGSGAYIVSFNLKNEELGMIKTVDHDSVSNFNIGKLAVVEEDLAMIYWKFSDGFSDGFQIWVMTDYGVEDSWVLKFDVSYQISSYQYPVGYLKYNVMIIEKEKQYYLLNLNTKEVEEIPNLGSRTLRSFCSFEESFAPVRYLI